MDNEEAKLPKIVNRFSPTYKRYKEYINIYKELKKNLL